VLNYPNFTKPLILTCDASGFAVGTILGEGKIRHDKPISFASRMFNRDEQGHSTIERELTAIVWACRHFGPYLIGRIFIIVTDHKPLTWMFSVKDPSSILLRRCLLLEEFDYTVQYKAGKKNVNADALSRNPVLLTTMITSKEKQQEMHECPIGGHRGVQRPYDRLKLYVTWPGMFHDVEYITNCKTCQKNKFKGPYIKAPFQERRTEFHPWDKLFLEIVGPLPITEKCHRCILRCQGNLSKYLLAIPIMTQTADVALNFMRHIALQYGILGSLVTD
jgi:hypothetical protein